MTDELHGLRTSAGQMLSKFLRQVGQEKTEVGGNDPETGNARVISKAESLARTIWKLALGWEETLKETDVSGKTRIVTRQHKPDGAMISLVFDRIEGKVASPESDKSKKQPLSGKVAEQAKRRVNALVESDDGGDT